MRRLAFCLGVTLLAGCGDNLATTLDAGGQDASTRPDAEPSACIAEEPFEWPVSTSSVTITPSDAWKNQVSVDDDPFLSAWSPDQIRWIKFAILVKDPTKVYFQNSSEHQFHYDFASQFLDPFDELTRSEFDQISLHEQDQEVILGALLIPQRESIQEIGIQLVRHDPYHPEMVKTLIDLITANVAAPPETNILYMPTFEQTESAEECTAWFADHGIDVSSVDRWIKENSCYSDGWGIGRLVFVTADGIDQAYTDGTLTPSDVLLTDGIPAEVPFLAGMLTTAPTTSNSHVAILARSYGVPFAHLADEAQVADVQALVGNDILLRAYSTFEEPCSVRVTDVEGQISTGDRAELLALKAPPELQIQAIETFSGYSRSVTGLTKNDVRYFGGKATNFAVLRAAIPDNSPDAIALSFDLWTDFMDQDMPSGKTLRQDITALLGGFSYPPNMAEVETALQQVRDLIKNQASFAPSQRAAITAAISGYAADKKLRFRSSTNVEDTEYFVGAGLYDSYSGCRADDEDADEIGPSLCDSTKVNERGVRRAIRKVYASFYNNNAFLERLRYGVDETEVGMAILVHTSFPDEIELANGVAVAQRTEYSTQMELVSQLGAHSVANPEGGATPEIVSGYYNESLYADFLQASSLVALGDKVMDWPTNYDDLADLLDAVGDAYSVLYPELSENFILDFEYKKIEPNDLVVKQVRRLPVPDPEARWATYLVNSPRDYCIFQGEHGSAFANHRLKSQWTITTTSLWTSEANLASSFYTDIDLTYLEGTSEATLSGDPGTWLNASHSYEAGTVSDFFSIGSGGEGRDFVISMEVPLDVLKSQSPARTLDDNHIMVTVTYATPQPSHTWEGPTTITSEHIRLGSCPKDNVVTEDNPKNEETITAGGITVETAYWWPKVPRGIVAGYTAPLHRWDKTTITGLTTTPIVLTGDNSQTYRPNHHNFSNNYIFDPWLEPGIAQATLDELTDADVRLLFINQSLEIWVLTLDGKLEQLE